MKLTFYIAKDYENEPCLRTPGKQTQSNPISKGIPILLCGALLRAGLLRTSQDKFATANRKKRLAKINKDC